MAWTTKILFKKQLFDLEVKGQDPTKVITVCDTLPYGHAPTYQINTITIDLSRKTNMLWPGQENTIEKTTRYDYNLTIMKSPKPATDNQFKK
jgi:hypothetical protein